MTSPVIKKIRISNPHGLHLRSAGALVQKMSRFKSKVFFKHGAVEANGKSIMSVLALGAPVGSEIEIQVQGPDAEEAMLAIEQFFALDAT